jgi:hypothetical protein
MGRAYGGPTADPADVATLPPGVTGMQREGQGAEFGDRKTRPAPGVLRVGTTSR